ncbi:hypothetical protein [Dyella tabacisoli]|uniref:Uncharacterized protein n=1 Tax=Dyella tabacisoli TaxID=2282381 RepID=A0A369UTK3_9GAMM|nr:hypothetical protein [Dyella tabacisoli]RDD82930.1 hypothetical protein DVJ77_05305 [Dyella tabacisoli]
MFGWFAHALTAVCPHAGAGSASRRWLRITPESLLAYLPLLGSVLYLPSRAKHPTTGMLPNGWLVERAELEPLLHTCWLIAASAINVDGPREWLECIDAQGCLRARLHLLPDTDYLAWDALLAQGKPLALPPHRRVQQPLRLASASVMVFQHRRLAGLSILSSIAPSRLSTLGQGIARDVARAEAGL